MRLERVVSYTKENRPFTACFQSLYSVCIGFWLLFEEFDEELITVLMLSLSLKDKYNITEQYVVTREVT